MNKFRNHKYEWSHPYSSIRHQWSFIGPVGGISFTASIMDDKSNFPEPTCGLEFHHSARAKEGAYLIDGNAPHHSPCWLIGEPCWHDGTSLYASETVWPIVEVYLERGEHRAIFNLLEYEYNRHFEPAPDDIEDPSA